MVQLTKKGILRAFLLRIIGEDVRILEGRFGGEGSFDEEGGGREGGVSRRLTRTQSSRTFLTFQPGILLRDKKRTPS